MLLPRGKTDCDRAQVDWGEVRQFPFTQQPPATRYFLACRLKYSRWTWVRFTTDMRQETLFRGLVECFAALGFVPWVLVFDNMKMVTTGRDAQEQSIWHPVLLQLAAEFDFHPEACWPGAGNQKGSVESLVKWVKGNFLVGCTFADDADLASQCTEWLQYANTRPLQATDVPPLERLVEEAAKGGQLPARTEHLLLGLLRLRSGMPSRVLVRFGVDLRRARDGVAFTIGPGNQPFDGPLGLTPRAKKVMELAIEASRQAHEVSVCPEHLLLAIINEGAGIATGILEAMGVQLSPLADRVRAASSAASKAR